MRRTTDALEILDALDGNDPDREAMMAAARLNGDVCLEVYRLRTESLLTQSQLAQRVGCPPSLIDDLESGDFEGDSLGWVQRIADSLGVPTHLNAMDYSLAIHSSSPK